MLNLRRSVRILAMAVALAVLAGLTLQSQGVLGGMALPRPPGGPPPLLLPPDTQYTPIQAGTRVVNPDGRPVAQLATIPANLQGSVAVKINAHAGEPGDPVNSSTAVVYEILSSVRYSGDSQIVMVTTSRASATAEANEAKGMSLGNQRVTLSDGTAAYVSALPQWQKGDVLITQGKTQVVWQKDGLLVTVAGDLPTDDLVALASQVTLAK